MSVDIRVQSGHDDVFFWKAIIAAVADAGLELADIDGLVAFGLDSNGPAAVAATLGLGPLRYFGGTLYGVAVDARRCSTPPWRSPPEPPTSWSPIAP